MTVVSRQLKVVFVHLPKCGGTTVTELLRPYISDEEFEHWYVRRGHATVRMIESAAGLHDYRWFTTVREPLSRLRSLYFYKRNQPPNSTQRGITECRYRSFNDWVNFFLSEEYQPSEPDSPCMFHPHVYPRLRMTEALTRHDGSIVDNVIRVEDGLVCGLEKLLGMSFERRRSNVSTRNADPTIDLPTWNLVREYYATDYERWYPEC